MAIKLRNAWLCRSSIRLSGVMARRNRRIFRWTGSRRKAITAPIKMGRRMALSVLKKRATAEK